MAGSSKSKGLFFDLFLSLMLVLAWASTAQATTYYVSPTGSDYNLGTSTGQAFQTIQHAADLTNPGDTVLVMPGTYMGASPGAFALAISRSGTASAYITYKAYTEATTTSDSTQHSIIKNTANTTGDYQTIANSDEWNAIAIDAAYIIIDGFEVEGEAKNLDLSYALSTTGYSESNFWTNGGGITVTANSLGGPTLTVPGAPEQWPSTPHHIIIRNNIVHDVPGGGIGAGEADYITIENNVIYNTSWWSCYNTSGISLYEMRDIDTNTGYKNYVLNNITHDNQAYVPFAYTGTTMATRVITDGNGIIIDDNKNTQSINIPYGGRTLVANNLTYNNGGSGIHAFESQHVDIVNNTAYMNNRADTLNNTTGLNEGQIFAAWGADDIYILSNIAEAPAGKILNPSNSWGATNIVDDYNVYTGTGSIGVQGAHDKIVANPLFVSTTLPNFQLQATSPAIGAGSGQKAYATDMMGTARPTGGRYDAGAYQYQSAVAPVTPAACGATPSGSTATNVVSTTSGSIAATTTQCPYGGTQATTTTVTQTMLCANGSLVAQGLPVSITVNSGSPTCNAPKACTDTLGVTHASGSSYTLQLSTSNGTAVPTVAECPYGGSQATITAVAQNYSCTNGVQTAVGMPLSTTTNSGNPVCAAPVPCGSTPSGSIVINTLSTTSGSIAATSAQCAYGGTQATVTTVKQAMLCTNGTLAAQGSPVTTTVNSGSPTCTAAPLVTPPSSTNPAPTGPAPVAVDTPLVTLPTSPRVMAQSTTTISGISIADAWAASNSNNFKGQIVVDLVAYEGGLIRTSATSPAKSMQIKGTLSQVNAALATLQYIAPNKGGSDLLTITPWNNAGKNSIGKLTINLGTQIIVKAAGDQYNGAPEMKVYLDGTLVAARSVSAVASGGQSDTFTFNVATTTKPKKLDIAYTNDAWGGYGKDRNLYIVGLSINGSTHTMLNPTFETLQGVVESSTGGNWASSSKLYMYSDGIAEYTLP